MEKGSLRTGSDSGEKANCSTLPFIISQQLDINNNNNNNKSYNTDNNNNNNGINTNTSNNNNNSNNDGHIENNKNNNNNTLVATPEVVKDGNLLKVFSSPIPTIEIYI